METACLDMNSSVELAVCLNSVQKSFGSFGQRKNVVLQSVNLSVPLGSIYGLLGASGCGKTTLLKCAIGQMKPDSGIIRLSDNISGKNYSKRLNVGYMPQETALFGELTIKETLVYFGGMQMMASNRIQERVEFLLEFLNLPKDWKLIKNFSGGQKRRVSFAVALLHEPPLLILDEPTVGMDPLLRISIWDHLLKISQSGKVTTIITTHYIEEAKQADKVGFLRDGRILAEDSPNSLINRYQLSSLEDVYLYLCKNDVEVNKNDITENGIQKKDKKHPEPFLENETPNLLDDAVVVESTKNKSPVLNTLFNFFSLPNKHNILAVTRKNLIKLFRQPSVLFFQFLIPGIQILLVCLAFAGTPQNLKIAVVNEDNLMGRTFVQLIDNTTIHQIPVDNRKIAENMVLNVEVCGLIHIWKNFTTSIKNRLYNPDSETNEMINSSIIYVKLDMVEQQIGYTIMHEMSEALKKFAKISLAMEGINNSLITNPPLHFEEPTYGQHNPNFMNYLAPGAILIISFFVAMALTALDFVLEKKEGLLDRSYVAGLTPFELMCGHILTHLGTMILENGLVLIILIYGFNFPVTGNIILIIFLSLIQGIAGMYYGYLLAIILEEEYSIVVVGVGSVFPALLMSGIVWPVEAMTDYLQFISNLFPQTYATKAMRCIFFRGKGITFMQVWRGFLATFIWINFMLLAISVLMKIKQR